MKRVRLKEFGINTRGRDIAVGDIHGHFFRLQHALGKIGFDPSVDRLFSVGDLVDKGPDSVLAARWLDKPWFHAVRGNHDDLARRYFLDNELSSRDYMHQCGADWLFALSETERFCFAHKLGDLPLSIEVETSGGTVGIVHADCPLADWTDWRDYLRSGSFDARLEQRSAWDRDRINAFINTEVAGVRAVVVGHTPVDEYVALGNVHYIDTGAWKASNPGAFTFLDLQRLEVISS